MVRRAALPMKPLPLLLALMLPVAASAQAPGATPAPAALPRETAQPMWRCQLPGGSYSVALSAIVSVSWHEYVVDAAARVTEVNIETTGSVLARFYFLEPNTPSLPSGLGAATIGKAQQLLTEGAEKTGQDVWRKVVKNYPATTHARTVEYRLASRDALMRLYESAESAFRLGRNGTFKAE
jgi:hypothetical protein